MAGTSPAMTETAAAFPPGVPPASDVVFLFLFIRIYASLLLTDPGASPGGKGEFCAPRQAKKFGNKNRPLGLP